MDRSLVYDPEIPLFWILRPLSCIKMLKIIVPRIIRDILLILYGIACKTGQSARCTRIETGRYADYVDEKRDQ